MYLPTDGSAGSLDVADKSVLEELRAMEARQLTLAENQQQQLAAQLDNIAASA